MALEFAHKITYYLRLILLLYYQYGYFKKIESGMNLMSKNLEIDRHLAISDVFRYYGYKAQDIHQVNGGTVGYTFSIDDKYF